MQKKAFQLVTIQKTLLVGGECYGSPDVVICQSGHPEFANLLRKSPKIEMLPFTSNVF